LFTTVLAACLAFTTTFLVERYSAVQAELKELRRENRDRTEANRAAAGTRALGT